jgi:glycine/D-amino acid oxidase-like deaminating enzyme
MNITIVGAGFSGLTTAIKLLRDGHKVKIVSAEPPELTTSMLAGAIWHPFYQAYDSNYLEMATTTYAELEVISRSEDSGVKENILTEYFKSTLGAPWWMKEMQNVVPVEPGKGSEYLSAYSVKTFVSNTPTYLKFLQSEVIALGGELTIAYVENWETLFRLGADTVVNCASFGSSDLCGDTAMRLVRGVIVYVEKPEGFKGCFIDDTDRRFPTYLIERDDVLVVGGTADSSLSSTIISSSTIEDIMARCSQLNPSLKGAKILGSALGFRPNRSLSRVEQDDRDPRLIHNYGHGGSGFTLSWGAASKVSTIISQTN